MVKRNSLKLKLNKLIDTKLRSQCATTLVFVNGYYAEEFSETSALPAGIIVTDLAQAQKKHPELLTQHQHDQSNNLAGSFIYVPENTIIQKPIHIIYWQDQALNNPHNNLFIIAPKCKIALLVTQLNAKMVTDAVDNTYLQIAEDAQVIYSKLQTLAPKTNYHGNLKITVAQNSAVQNNYFGLGGNIASENIEIFLQDNNANCSNHGFCFTCKKQHHEYRLNLQHLVPQTTSETFCKSITNDKAQNVFYGKITIAKDAQQSAAKLKTQNLLLAPSAHVMAKPELEIYADDVKCSHGATIGELDTQALFYLRSRGLSIDDARALLLNAFTHEILDKMTEPTTKEYFSVCLQKLISPFSNNSCAVKI